MTIGTTAEQDIIKTARSEIERKTGKTPEQLYEEREKRVKDATALREPDRVPLALGGGYFPLKYIGASLSAEYYEPSIYRQGVIKTLLDFEPDMYRGTTSSSNSGVALEAFGPRYARWPGGPLSLNLPLQVLDRECMKAEDYDIFLSDPTDFMLRYYLPRAYEALEPLSKLPTLGQNLAGAVTGLLGISPILASSEFQKLAQILFKAGQEQAKFRQGEGEVAALGFPPFYFNDGVNKGKNLPFDWIADYLRGMSGIMVDMFERPEKLIAACEKVLAWRLARAAPADPTKKGHPRRVRGGTTHFSADRFISKKHFETFVWPTWKSSLLADIKLGFVPWVHFEGICDDRMEYFLELPKGKVIIMFEQGDMAKAKEVIGGHCCIQGNLPFGLLEAGSPQEVEEYCKKLIRVCGKGGGYILDSGSSLTEAKPANVRAMVDAVNKYGQY